mgnify:CR=1 FL=1
MKSKDRATELLEAVYNLLIKQNETGYVLNILEQEVSYDGTICDGYCLLDDIKDYLGKED